MAGIDERMDDMGEGWGDTLLCRDCIYRKADSILPDGYIIPQADNCECDWYEVKPFKYMKRGCPHYRKEEKN